MPFSFNAVEICVVTINEKPWTRAGEVCMALRYELSGTTVPGKIFSIIISWRPYPRWVRLLIGQEIHKN